MEEKVNLSSADAPNLDRAKILSSDKGLTLYWNTMVWIRPNSKDLQTTHTVSFKWCYLFKERKIVQNILFTSFFSHIAFNNLFYLGFVKIRVFVTKGRILICFVCLFGVYQLYFSSLTATVHKSIFLHCF